MVETAVSEQVEVSDPHPKQAGKQHSEKVNVWVVVGVESALSRKVTENYKWPWGMLFP